MQWLTENWLATLVLVGALLYLMQRAAMACGVTQRRPHAQRRTEVDWSATDPVSAEKVAPDAPLVAQHGGRLYRFASRETLERFESDPERYLRGGAGRHGPGASHGRGGQGGCC